MMIKKILLLIAFTSTFVCPASATNDYPAGDKKPIIPLIMKRLIAHLSPAEFTELTGRKLNLLEKLAYRQIRKKYTREMDNIGLMEAMDTLYMADGSIKTGIVLADAPGKLTYKTAGAAGLSQTNQQLVRKVRYADAVRAFTQKQDETALPYEKNASASLWLGLAAILSLFIPILNLLSPALAIAAIVTGIIGHSNIKKSNGTQKGKGRATAGIIMGGFYFLLLIVVIVIFVALISGGVGG